MDDADALISECAHQIVSSKNYNIYILYYYISIYHPSYIQFT